MPAAAAVVPVMSPAQGSIGSEVRECRATGRPELHAIGIHLVEVPVGRHTDRLWEVLRSRIGSLAGPAERHVHRGAAVMGGPGCDGGKAEAHPESSR